VRPTFSIICFTVLSGVGYGAWFLMGVGLAIGPICGAPQATAHPVITLRTCHIPFFDHASLLLALLLVVAGLLASLGHLGKPSRAWRALSQWRSSWLSREGVAALLTFVPASLLVTHAAAEAWLIATATADHVAPRSWNGLAWSEGIRPLLGAWLAAGSLGTVFCTANIYASLKTIRAWHERHVVPGYLLLAAYGGTLLVPAAATLDGMLHPVDHAILGCAALVLAAAGAWLKLRYWRAIDAQPATTAGHATGLEHLGDVRSMEAPHTEESYLTHEMGFVLARRHARKLRRIALWTAFAFPAALTGVGVIAQIAGAVSPAWHLLSWAALASGAAGLFVERWLFFAEARHTVMAYYAR